MAQPHYVGEQLAAATADARAGLRALDCLIVSVLGADVNNAADELYRLKREAQAYRTAGEEAART